MVVSFINGRKQITQPKTNIQLYIFFWTKNCFDDFNNHPVPRQTITLPLPRFSNDVTSVDTTLLENVNSAYSLVTRVLCVLVMQMVASYYFGIG